MSKKYYYLLYHNIHGLYLLLLVKLSLFIFFALFLVYFLCFLPFYFFLEFNSFSLIKTILIKDISFLFFSLSLLRLEMSDNFCYHKVVRAITKWGEIEKSPLFENVTFLKGTKKLFCIFGAPIIFW